MSNYPSSRRAGRVPLLCGMLIGVFCAHEALAHLFPDDKYYFNKFDITMRPVQPRDALFPENHADSFCRWIAQAPARRVCTPIRLLGDAIHSFGIDEEASDNGIVEEASDEVKDGSEQTSTTIINNNVASLDPKYPRDWSVGAMGLLDFQENRDSYAPKSLTDAEFENAQIREAIFWAFDSRRRSATLDELEMNGRWKAAAILHVPNWQNRASNVAVVFVAASTADRTKTDVLVAIRGTAVASDSRFNLDVDQEIVQCRGEELALHSGYSRAAKVLMQQLQNSLASLIRDGQLGKLTLAGFSLGGGIASALGVHIVGSLEIENSPAGWHDRLHIATFGAPRWGNKQATRFLPRYSRMESFVAKYDIIPSLPCKKSPICFSLGHFTHKATSAPVFPTKWVAYDDNPNPISIDPFKLNDIPAMHYHAMAYDIFPNGTWYTNRPAISNEEHSLEANTGTGPKVMEPRSTITINNSPQAPLSSKVSGGLQETSEAARHLLRCRNCDHSRGREKILAVPLDPL